MMPADGQTQNTGSSSQKRGGESDSSMQAAISTAAALAAASATTADTVGSQYLYGVPQQPQHAPQPLAQAPVMPAPVSDNPVDHNKRFDPSKLRRGKWTAEEEEYADFLIEEFEKGTVEGCENGCTLRSFLSKKLHCAPMRISKKYAGKSIGKHVFLARTSVNGMMPGTGSNREKMKELESRFYNSLTQDIEAPALALFTGGQQHVGISQYAQGPIPAASLQVYSTPGGVQNFVAYPPHQTPVTHPAAHGVRAQYPWLVANPAPALVTPAHRTDQSANQLHQTYLSALHYPAASVSTSCTVGHPQAKTVTSSTSASPSPSSTQAPQPIVALSAPITSLIARPPSVPHPQPTPSSNSGSQMLPNKHPLRMPTLPSVVNPLNPSYVAPPAPQLVHHPAQIAPPVRHVQPPGAQALTHGVHILHHTNHAIVQPNTAHEQKTVDVEKPDEIPDFLSGFEKIAAAVGPRSRCENSIGGPPSHSRDPEHSPPFTSRSFDDFHRFLGKGLSPCGPFDLNDTKDQPKAVTADTYAIFAQQSVLAVSQHSAYCRNEFPNSTKTSGDGIVNVANLLAHDKAAEVNATGRELAVHYQPANVVSASEKSSSDSGDNGSSNESDSNSEGPPRKKQRSIVVAGDQH